MRQGQTRQSCLALHHLSALMTGRGMKKPRNTSSLFVKCCRNDSKNKNKNKNKSDSLKSHGNKNSFNELSLSLIFTLWGLVLFYSRFGLIHGNADNRGMSWPSVSADKLSEDACSLVANGSNNQHTEGVRLKLDISASSNNSTTLHDIIIYNCCLRLVYAYSPFMSEEQPQNARCMSHLKELPNGTSTQPTYPNFDEFRYIKRQEKDQDIHNRLVNITHRLEPDGTEYNYASASKGAKLVAHNKEAKGASNILGKDHDKYLRNPCSVGEKFVVIELAEETLVDAVKIANFEHYSSTFKEFELSGSLSYPTEIWSPLGKFVAANVKHVQSFTLPEPKWVRYLKLKLLSHFGTDFYCTLSVVEVYGVDAIERMLEDLFVVPEELVPSELPEPNSSATPPSRQDVFPIDSKRNDEVQNGGRVETASKGIENTEDAQRLDADVTKNPVTTNKIPGPSIEVRQLPNGRIPGDTVLKILMQKIRSLELNFSVLAEYIKELCIREGEALSNIDKEILRILVLLEKSQSDIRDLMEWKETMDKGMTDIESWKATISSLVDALAIENSMLRLDVEKVATNQANMENKELAVLAISVLFISLAILKLVSSRVSLFMGACQSDKVCQANRGWFLILISSSMTIFIILLSS